MLRILTALCAVAGLVLALNVSSAGAQYAGSAVTVSVRALRCADASGASCEEPFAGVSYTIAEAGQDNGVGATTGADGGATLSPPVADDAETVSVIVVGSLPAGYERSAVSCGDPETGAEVPVQTANGGVSFSAEPGDLIACDWAFIPAEDPAGEDGSVTIYKTACPAGYDGDDYDEDCYDNPVADVSFSILRTGTDNAVSDDTDANGVVAFPLSPFAPGSFSVNELNAGGTGTYAVFCTKDGGTAVVDVAYTGSGDVQGITFDAEAGDEIACDWFNLPAGSADPTPAPSASPKPSATPDRRSAGFATPGPGSPPARRVLGSSRSCWPAASPPSRWWRSAAGAAPSPRQGRRGWASHSRRPCPSLRRQPRRGAPLPPSFGDGPRSPPSRGPSLPSPPPVAVRRGTRPDRDRGMDTSYEEGTRSS